MVRRSENLNKATKNKRDEFYTSLDTVEKEMEHYKNQFRGKVIYCNCDNPKESNFVKYFSTNFKRLGLKKLIAAYYKKTRSSITGDFRSDESIALLKESDIVITNPPFSLFCEFVDQLMFYHKKFLILGDQNAITYKNFFIYIKENKLWFGYNNIGTKWFRVPMNYGVPTKSNEKIENGTKYISMGKIWWFTNINTNNCRANIVLHKKYTQKEFPKYDNYDIINVDKVSDIPMDYTGVMGVPITFMAKYNPKQFEILGRANWNSWVGYKCFTIIQGRHLYHRILIKRKI